MHLLWLFLFPTLVKTSLCATDTQADPTVTEWTLATTTTHSTEEAFNPGSRNDISNSLSPTASSADYSSIQNGEQISPTATEISYSSFPSMPNTADFSESQTITSSFPNTAVFDDFDDISSSQMSTYSSTSISSSLTICSTDSFIAESTISPTTTTESVFSSSELSETSLVTGSPDFPESSISPTTTGNVFSSSELSETSLVTGSPDFPESSISPTTTTGSVFSSSELSETSLVTGSPDFPESSISPTTTTGSVFSSSELSETSLVTGSPDFPESSILSTSIESSFESSSNLPEWNTATDSLGTSISTTDPDFTVSTSNVQSTPEISFSTTISDAVPTSSYLPTTEGIPTTSRPVEPTITPDNTFRPIEVLYSLQSSIQLTSDEMVRFRILLWNEIDYTGNISTALTTAYSHIPGFIALRVADVSENGPTIQADYSVDLLADDSGETNVEELTNEIKDKVIPILEEQLVFGNYTFNKTHFEERINDPDFMRNIRDPACDRLVVKCPLGYGCFIHGIVPLCRSLCSGDDKPDCGENGACSLDSQTGEPICRCFESDEFTFSGEFCEEKKDKFAMSKGSIIGLGVGIGVAVFLISVIIIVFLINKLRGMKGKNDNTGFDEDWYHRDTNMSGGIQLKHYNPPGNIRSTPNIYELGDSQQGEDNIEEIVDKMFTFPTFDQSGPEFYSERL